MVEVWLLRLTLLGTSNWKLFWLFPKVDNNIMAKGNENNHLVRKIDCTAFRLLGSTDERVTGTFMITVVFRKKSLEAGHYRHYRIIEAVSLEGRPNGSVLHPWTQPFERGCDPEAFRLTPNPATPRQEPVIVSAAPAVGFTMSAHCHQKYQMN